MKVVYVPETTQTHVLPEEFTATWEEGTRKYRLKIWRDEFEITRWNSGAYQYTDSLGYHPSAEKVLEAIEKYKDRLDIES